MTLTEVLHGTRLIGFFTTCMQNFQNNIVVSFLGKKEKLRVILDVFKFRCCVLVLLEMTKLEINLYWSTRPSQKKSVDSEYY